MKLKLYEQYTGGEITKNCYLEQKTAIDETLATTAAESTALEAAIAELEATNSQHETAFEKSCNSFFGETTLTHESAHAFVKAIYVFADKHIEIHWKFSDVFGDAYDTT